MPTAGAVASLPSVGSLGVTGWVTTPASLGCAIAQELRQKRVGRGSLSEAVVDLSVVSISARRHRSFSLICVANGLSNDHPTTSTNRIGRRRPRPRERAAVSTGASAARSPPMPVDPAGASSASLSSPATAGAPGPSVPSATLAVARGDIVGGLDMFLQCMARRRLRLFRAVGGIGSRAAAAQGQGGVPACNKFLRALGDAGRIDEAVSAYEAMSMSGLRPTIVTFSTLISRAGACRRILLAERFYGEMLKAGIKPDVQAMNSLINAFSKAGSPDQALKVFDQMARYGVAPSVITFNTLIDACARAGDIERARSVFDRLEQAGLRPNDRTFSSLIHTHAVKGQVDEAFSLLKGMRAEGLVPNRVIYSALINACGRAGQLARAFQTLDEMCSLGIEPNVITWTTLIDACGKGKELEWSFRLFSEMRESGIVPNGVTCSALMDACLKADELDLAFAVLEHMLDVGIEPTEVTYTSLLTQCARLGKADKAGIVLDGLNKKRTVSASNSTAVLGAGSASTRANVAVGEDGIARDSKASAAEDAGRGAGGRGQKEGDEVGSTWSIDPKLENDLLKLFGQADQVDEAFKVLESMLSRRESPDSDTWLVLLNAVGTAGELDKAVALMERSRVEGRKSEINELTYSALLGACGRAKKLARAFRVVEGMRDTGVKLTEGTYVALLDACRRTRDSKAAVQVFETMETDGVRPGVQSYTYLLQVISDENTRRTRALQRSRQLENRGDASTNKLSLVPASQDFEASTQSSPVPDYSASAVVGEAAVSERPISAFEVAVGTRPAHSRAKGNEGVDSAPTGAFEAASGSSLTSSSEAAEPPVVDSAEAERMCIRQQEEAVLGAAGAALPEASCQHSVADEINIETRGSTTTFPAEAAVSSALGGGLQSRSPLSPAGSGAPTNEMSEVLGVDATSALHSNLISAILKNPSSDDPKKRPEKSSTNFAHATASPPLLPLDEAGRATGTQSAIDIGGSSDIRTSAPDEKDSPIDGLKVENPALDNLFRVFLVFQEMRSRGVKPDLRAYNALVNTCAEVGELDRALEVVRQMVDEDHGGGLQPDAVTYTSLIKAAARSTPPRVEEAEEIFAVMQQRTNHFSTFARPTEVTYAHLMRASVEAGDYKRALEVWWQQLAAGVAPGSRSTRAALTACWGAGDIDTALEVYRMMREARIRPDNRSTLEIVKLCRANDMPGLATTILNERSSFVDHGRTNHRESRRHHLYNHHHRERSTNAAHSSNETLANSTPYGQEKAEQYVPWDTSGSDMTVSARSMSATTGNGSPTSTRNGVHDGANSSRSRGISSKNFTRPRSEVSESRLPRPKNTPPA